MSNKYSVAYNDAPDISAGCKGPNREPIKEILFMPSTGECLFLDPDHYDELVNGKDGDTPHIANKAIEEIGKKNISEQEKAKEVNNVLFNSQKIDESGFADAIKFAECIGLSDKKPVMVAKKFIKKFTDNENLHVKLVETGGEEGEDIFKDYRIEVVSKTNKKPKKILKKKIDKELRNAYLERFHRKIKSREDEVRNGLEDSELSSQQTQQLKAIRDELFKHVNFPEPIKSFIDDLKVELMGEWEASYSVWEDERNWNNEEKKRQILVGLKDPEAVKEEKKENNSYEESEFNQDDAEVVFREVKDLWYKEDDHSVYDEIMTDSQPLTPNLLFTDEDIRNDFIQRVKNADVPPSLFEASLSAAVMRMSASAESSFSSNIAEGKLLDVNIDVKAKLALAEGKGSMQFKLPDENGYAAEFKLNKKFEKKQWDKVTIDNSLQYPANFYFDSSFIAPHTAAGLLSQVNALADQVNLDTVQLIALDIVGHTDAKGTDDYNQNLGLKRAEAAYAFLKGDYVGLASFFQKGDWNEDHFKFMQAYLCACDGSSTSLFNTISGGVSEIKRVSAPDIKDALKHPDYLSENIKKFSEYNSLLEQTYPGVYESYANTSVDPELLDTEMPKFRKELAFLDGYSNEYVMTVLKAYRKSFFDVLSQNGVGLNEQHFVFYPESVISRGEQELLIDTQDKNEANRRVVIKGYTLQNNSETKEATLSFGVFRLDLEGYVSGFAGANIALSGSAELSVDPNSINPECLLFKGLTQDEDEKGSDNKETNKALADRKSEKQTAKKDDDDDDDEEQPVTAETEGKAEFFAGVKAETGLKAGLLWHELNPPAVGWWELGNVGYAVTGSVGLSAEAEFKIGYNKDSGKFILKARASATLGVGGGGELQFSVGLGGLWCFAQYVYKQIKENDFSFVDIFDDDDVFSIFCGWYIRLIQLEIDIAVDTAKALNNAALEIASGAQKVLSHLNDVKGNWELAQQKRDEVIALVEAIKNNSEMLAHATPEVKGRILYLLTQYRTSTLWQDIMDWDINGRSEKAAVNLITRYIVSMRDWQETFEHMAEEKENGEIGPYLGSGDKGATPSDEKLKKNQKRMEFNELWLKTNLLNDAHDWDKVMAHKNALLLLNK